MSKSDTPVSEFELINCNETEHAAAILDILNDAILNSTALYDYHPRTLQNMQTWFANKREQHFPVLGIINKAGKLLGFASWGTFRAFPAYKYTVEHSVYIHPEHRSCGLSKILMQALIEKAEQQDIHVMVGCIDAENSASIQLHQKLGFTHSGTIQQAGFKFGRWLDAAFYQLILKTPLHPQDG